MQKDYKISMVSEAKYRGLTLQEWKEDQKFIQQEKKEKAIRKWLQANPRVGTLCRNGKEIYYVTVRKEDAESKQVEIPPLSEVCRDEA